MPRMSFHGPWRCRTASNRQMAVAAAAFSDSTLPGIGMVIFCVVIFNSSADSPAPSLPTKNATLPRRSQSYRLCAAFRPVASKAPRKDFATIIKSCCSYIRSTKCPPIAARSTFGDQASAQPADKNAASHPAAAADRNIEPRLPGS